MRQLTILLISLALVGCEETPSDGADGRNGADGRDGMDGADAVVADDFAAGIPEDGPNLWEDYFSLNSGSGRRIVARGGTGLNGEGGAGADQVSISQESSAPGARILRTGSPNTTFAVPLYDVYLGENPRIVSQDETWTLASSLQPMSVVPGSVDVLGADGVNPATGLHVLPGVTLTLVPNIDTNNLDADNDLGTGTFDEVELEFSDGIWFQGRVVVVSEVLGRTASLSLESEQIRLGSRGMISTAGADHPAVASAGGDVELTTTGWEGGTLAVLGDIDTSGGNGGIGADGGAIYLITENSRVFATGHLDSSGGDGATGRGGHGGYIELDADSDQAGGLFMAGTHDLSGGHGGTGGGDAGDWDAYTEYTGAVVGNELTVIANGGSATFDGDGGEGGALEIDAYSGSIRISGVVRARGGAGAGTGDGGTGGSYNLDTDYDEYLYEAYVGGAGIFLGADIDVSGGDGANGGDAGWVDIDEEGYSEDYLSVGESPLILLGYDTIDCSGGDGTAGGGDGSDECEFYTVSGSEDQDGNEYSAGDVINEADWFNDGGDGGSGSGGDGGSIQMYTGASVVTLSGGPAMQNSGLLRADGGSSTASFGGEGGSIDLYGVSAADNSGLLSANGGDGLDDGGTGGWCGVYSDYRMSNVADVTVDGGEAGDGDGGEGGSVQLMGRRMLHDGDLRATGGDGSEAGGDGGFIELFSTEDTADLAGTAAAGGGAGSSSPGEGGEVYLDGVRVALDDSGEIEL